MGAYESWEEQARAQHAIIRDLERALAAEKAAREEAEKRYIVAKGACDYEAQRAESAERREKEARTALDSAAFAMTMSAAALRNGGGTGHEVVRLEEAAARARSLLASVPAGGTL
jgi:hypothetical protein